MGTFTMKNMIFTIVSIAVLIPLGMAHAGSPDKSFIAIAPDKKLCSGSEGQFLPLPHIDHIAASVEFMNSLIDKNYGKECRLNGLLLKGKISKKTLPQLKLGLQLLEARRNERSIGANTLWLDSPGGLITEGLKIGNIIAEKGMGAVVTVSGHCYSSCVFVYAAAKERLNFGEVGIHRPFAEEISTDSLSYPEYLEKYENLTPILKRYFSKYGVSPAIVDAMNIIPSDDIKILSQEERDSYGLGSTNIAAKEYEKARTIQICGSDYHNLHLQFLTALTSCYEKRGYFEAESPCQDIANTAFPRYSDEFDKCKSLQETRK